MFLRHSASRILCLCAILAAACAVAGAQNVKRVVIIKMDGLPGYYVDRFVKERDPSTGKSELPWFEEVFYRNGTRLPNFYTRGLSLSGPAWGQLDTGQRLQIKGNVEYDRYTLHSYDYLNFFPYYISYGMSKKVDMPAVEVMDQLEIPLLSDAFPFENRYTSHQLYQRGNDWAVLASGFIKLYPGDPVDFLNEWTMGLKFRSITIRQAERDILGKLVKRPDIDYFDYFETDFDHVSHHNNDKDSRLASLKQIDRLIGRVWSAIQASSRADETALILISDHGFNSSESAYSQGFNIVRMLGSPAGGGHHVVTKRRLMLEYSVKGLYPLTPVIKTEATDSYYLKGKSNIYPTALVDFDGNERSSIHLRNSDLNILHLLHQQLQLKKLAPDVRAAVTREFFKVVSRNVDVWRQTAGELAEELEALQRWTRTQNALPKSKKKPGEVPDRGTIERIRRAEEQVRIAEDTERQFKTYLQTLNNLLALNQERTDLRRVKIEGIIAPGSMGDPNSLFQLQNYIVGLSPAGLTLNSKMELDLEKSFVAVNYLELLHSQRVRNNVQSGVGNRPVDMVAVRLPLAGFIELEGRNGLADPIWLYGGPDRQVLLLLRTGPDGETSYRYLPISGLKAEPNGSFSFERQEISDGFPLHYFEDPDMTIPKDERRSWLNSWHTEIEWMRATHKTKYANAIVGINEHMQSHPLFDDDDGSSLSTDQKLIRRFRQRQRHLTEADMLVLAQDHWNFDVRGFNPGGNHGSFFRVSTNSTFMIAGGDRTGIPKGRVVDEPYDSMSFVPTVLRLMGKVDENNDPSPEIRQLRFRRFPGRVIRELVEPAK
ncbi:hypothetical protein BH20ACI2_BH20ACI2_09310 [soil metagenome]